MRGRRDSRRFARWIGTVIAPRLVGLALAALHAAAAVAQEPPSAAPDAPPTATVVEVVAVPLSEVTAAALRADAVMRAMRDDLQPVGPVVEVEQAMAKAQVSLARDEVRARRILAGQPSGETLEELETTWSARRRQMAGWAEVVSARSRMLEESLEELARMESVWSKTRDAAREAQAPDVVLTRIAEVRKQAADTAAATRQKQRALLTLQEKLGVLRADVDGVLGEVRRARSLFVTQLLEPQGPPIWKWFSGDHKAADVATEARDSLVSQRDAIASYVRANWSDVLLQLMVAAVVTLFLYRGRARAAKWAEDDPALESVTKAFSMPFSMGALLLVFLLGWANPLAPPALRDLRALLALIPAVLLLRQLVPPRLFAGVYGLAAFSVVDRIRSLLYASPRIEWLGFVFEMVAALLLTIWIFSPERVGDIGWSPDDWKRRLLLAVRKLVIALLAVAIVATCLGYVRLGSLLGDGSLRSAYVAIVIYAAAQVFNGLWTYLLRSRLGSSLRAVRHHRWLLQKRGHRVISTVFAVAWVLATLRSFALLSTVWETLSAVFGARFERGNFSVSLGDVVFFGVSVWAALLLSRFIRFVLEEDVYARVDLAHGATYAVSTLLHYCLIVGGFLVGVSVIGFDLSRFAILAGALGVGIGFGLQNIVNNFVSGLILLFERPIQVGDAVEVGTLSGEVRRIGIRASTIRTWDGAELIVPNGNLIAETVTNWTLTDRMKRIEIPVGVAYGSDPELVLRILDETARGNPNVVASPPVAILFVGFGDSSLDFEVRAWTPRFENWLTVRTELMVAINGALRAAGVEIPFPQRDLHVRSLDEKAAQRLRSRTEPES